MAVVRPDGAHLVRWAPKVPQHLIRRLYESAARRILDEELVDDVGYRLLERCRSIDLVTAAHRKGRISCPGCGALVLRSRPPQQRAQRLVCAGCGWWTTWGAYLRTYQRANLSGGSALPAFQEFCVRFTAAPSSEAKLLAIDRLINSYHHELKRSTRPAASHLIQGAPLDVLALLDAIGEIGGPDGSPAEIARRRDAARRAALGERLHQLRAGRGLTGRQLAELTGSSPSRICMVETGRVAPPGLVERIARALRAAPETVVELVTAAETIQSTQL